MKQHTPGPWAISDNMRGIDNLLVAGVTSNAEPIANCGIGKTGKANARLIAAAPDLLACLIDAVRSLEFAAPIIEAPENSAYRETIADARAAIAKATGGAE